MQRLRMITALGLLACPGAPVGGDSVPVDSGADPNAPVVESAYVTCYTHETGETFVQWTAGATATDKQGLGTIETFGRIDMSDAGGEIGTADLVCSDGACTASWRDGDFDLACDNVAVGTYDFSFVVVDIDGHESVPLVTHAEKTTEP